MQKTEANMTNQKRSETYLKAKQNHLIKRNFLFLKFRFNVHFGSISSLRQGQIDWFGKHNAFCIWIDFRSWRDFHSWRGVFSNLQRCRHTRI